jgi:hypothetical protein
MEEMKMKNKFFIIKELEPNEHGLKTLLVSLPVAWMDKKGTLNVFEITKSRALNKLIALQVKEAEIKALQNEIWSDIQYVIEDGKIQFNLDGGVVEVHPIEGLFIGMLPKVKDESSD